jgi:hypothetical protein
MLNHMSALARAASTVRFSMVPLKPHAAFFHRSAIETVTLVF